MQKASERLPYMEGKRSPTFSLDLPNKAGNSGLTYIWPFLGTGLLLCACWRVLIRKEGVIVKDSPRFRNALGIWDKVIVGTHLTPRSTKRFMNRLRCLAMRLRPGTEEETRWSILWRREAKLPTGLTDSTQGTLPESMLVALSAIYDIAAELIRNDELFSNVLKGKFERPGYTSHDDEPLVGKPMQNSLRSTIEKHKSEFGTEWPPSAEQRLAFLNLCADVTVRG